MLFLYSTRDNVNEVVSRIGNTGWPLSIAAKVVENSLTRFTYLPKVIWMTSRTKGQNTVKLYHVSCETQPLGKKKPYLLKLLLVCLMNSAQDSQSLVGKTSHQFHNGRCTLAIEAASRFI